MQIVVDVRERALIHHLSSILVSSVAMETKALDIGDIVFSDKETGNPVVIIERKSLTDLLSSIRDGRYAEQSHRLIHCGGVSRHNIVYLIEGIMHSLNSDSQRQLVHSTMTSLSLFKGFTVIRTASIQESAEFIVNMYKKITRDLAAGKHLGSQTSNDVTENNVSNGEDMMPNGGATMPNGGATPYGGFVKKVKKDNITQENIASIMLSQIPGVSAATAQEIVDQHGGSLLALIQLCKEHPDTAFQESFLTTGTKRRKLGSNVREALVKYLSTI